MNQRQIKGRIFDIQRFSIHDGPGIRTVVFLKGCALRCQWCCNPESQSFDIETRTIDGKQTTVGYDQTVEQVLQTVQRDQPYYYRSGGGMTLSGGECLCQPAFAKGLLQSAKELGIHTAIESMGCVDWQVIQSVLPYLDTYLLDIKQMDSKKHQQFTGKDNQLILENAKKIADSGQTNLIIRVPVVPTVNDTPAEIAAIAAFAQTLNGVTQLHLLPYHRLGQDKYQQLGRDYSLPALLPPTNEQMVVLKNVVTTTTNLICQIGG